MLVVLGVLAIVCLSGLFFSCITKAIVHRDAKKVQGTPLEVLVEPAKKNTTIAVVFWTVLSIVFGVLWAVVKGVFGSN